MKIGLARANSSIVWSVAAWTVVLGLSVAAQLLTPSGLPPAGAGKGTLHRSLPKAWLRVVAKFPAVPGGGSADGTRIELVAASDNRERVLGSAEFRSSEDLRSLLDAGALTSARAGTRSAD